MTLAELLKKRISTTGPITVAEFMAESLLHPTLGYYTTAHPFGAAGDFITAPEISQMFGELIGLALAQCWMDQGAPAPFSLVELGPGRGTLMSDLLRATRAVPGFNDAMELVLLEASDQLRQMQRDCLKDYSPQFTDTLDDLPPRPVFGVANEFFDALPIRQFVRGERFWRERHVGLSEGALTFGLGPESPQPALDSRLEDTAPGDLVEYAPALAPLVSQLGHHIAEHGGGFLIIDYGDWRSLGDTLQAVKGHTHSDPLEQPGQADLTAHVDFEAIAEAAGCAHTKLTPQGVFLERLGITPRAEALAARLSGPALERHVAAHRRLTHPSEMGNLFKVLGLFPPDQTPPPGLDT